MEAAAREQRRLLEEREGQVAALEAARASDMKRLDGVASLEGRVRALAAEVEGERERARRVEAEYLEAVREAGQGRAALLQRLDAWREGQPQQQPQPQLAPAGAVMAVGPAAAAAAGGAAGAGWWEQSQSRLLQLEGGEEGLEDSAWALKRELERVKRRAYHALRREERKAELFRTKCLEVHSTVIGGFGLLAACLPCLPCLPCLRAFCVGG